MFGSVQYYFYVLHMYVLLIDLHTCFVLLSTSGTCMYVCMYVHTQLCVCVCVCVCAYVRVRACVRVHVYVCVTCASACSVFEDYLLCVEQLCVCHYYPDKCNWANGLLLMSCKGHFQFNFGAGVLLLLRSLCISS